MGTSCGAPTATAAFFTRCCPMLLEVGAIAYWSLAAAPSSTVSGATSRT